MNEKGDRMARRQRLMTAEEVRALVNAALADPTVNLAAPLMFSLMSRESLRLENLSGISRGDYHPAVDDVRGSLTYRDGDWLRAVTLSQESELLLAAYLDR
ncbi:hypothetical protein ACH427_04590 [Streptomyces sp. NPDC020379]|uniref:hypothetical protein n=1 Tax=Streptomyces sp. NPDC020379 TaxID=3365071 RepID=UPI0037B074F9